MYGTLYQTHTKKSHIVQDYKNWKQKQALKQKEMISCFVHILYQTGILVHFLFLFLTIWMTSNNTIAWSYHLFYNYMDRWQILIILFLSTLESWENICKNERL